MRFLLNLIFILLVNFTPLRRAQTIDSVWFSTTTNFTYCSQQQRQIDVLSVNRYLDIDKSRYDFDFIGTSNETITSLNQEGTTYSSSRMEVKFGFQSFYSDRTQFCLDSVEGGCPIEPRTNFTIQRSYNLSYIPSYPLADITAQYSAIAADSSHLICIQFAPVGYQHPVWRKIFRWLPISLTFSAALVSFIGSVSSFHEEHHMILFSSNYAMLPGLLRLKTPGFFDLVFYSQFIVMLGQFNIEYPRFHALFTSNFSWSFLLFNQAGWLHALISRLFEKESTETSSRIGSTHSIPGYVLNRRQEIMNNVTNIVNDDESHINVAGTGMSNFAIATGIDINAMFFTMMVYMFIMIGSCLLLCLVTWIIFYMRGEFADNKSYRTKSSKMWDFTIGVLVRVMSLAYLPILILSFYQLMIPSYWYITLMAALFLMTPFLCYGYIAIKLLQIRPASFLYTEFNLLLRYGSLYNTFTDDTFQFFIMIIVYKSLVAAMIGLFQTSGLAQIILVILAESGLMTVMLIKLPYSDKQVNLIHVVLGFIRLIVLSLNIGYLPQVKATTLSKQYLAYVQMGFHCLAFFLFLVLQIKNLVTIATGIGIDELLADETGKPPARMVMWRKRNNKGTAAAPHQLHLHSSATLMSNMTTQQNASFYISKNNNNHRLTGDSQTLDHFTNYYSQPNQSNTVLKPDQVDDILPSLVADYLNHPAAASSSSHRVYRLDDDIIPSSEPLLEYVMNPPPLRSQSTPPLQSPPLRSSAHSSPPPLPRHLVLNNNDSSSYSPPHQPSPTSILIQEKDSHCINK